jgi:hypothetical protein
VALKLHAGRALTVILKGTRRELAVLLLEGADPLGVGRGRPGLLAVVMPACLTHERTDSTP